jgi:predicted TPR repeat methyltransferase
MDTRDAYDQWSEQYDTNVNRTRDGEGAALRHTLSEQRFRNCLELGCGTGKNTAWLIQITDRVTAVDLSPQMLRKAKEKITSEKVRFLQDDILGKWDDGETYDLVVCSLVLEHIEHLGAVFQQVAKVLQPGGVFYVGELHPFRQYGGSKARFTTEAGEQVVTCFDHHISDFTRAAKSSGLRIAQVEEFFDDDDRTGLPRILALLFTA